jgi:hypothetical protein
MNEKIFETGGLAVEEAPVEERAEEEQGSFIEFQGADNSRQRVVHPEISGDVSGTLKATDLVEISGLEDIEEMSFGQYLKRIGVDYEDYYEKTKNDPNLDQNEILRDLHQQAVDSRIRDAIKKNQEYGRESATRDNLQRVTTEEHSRLFNKTINDLGIDGLESQAAPVQVDVLNKVDEILALDHDALETGGEKSGRSIYIGIQRSFADKKREVTSDPICFIPERPEIGALFTVFIQEDLDEYIDKRTGASIWQKLLDIRSAKARAAGMDPKQFAKLKRNEGMPTVDKVLPGGVRDQVAKVKKVLKAVSSQLETYIDSPHFKTQSPEVQRQLKGALKDMRIEDFLEAVDDLKKAA